MCSAAAAVATAATGATNIQGCDLICLEAPGLSLRSGKITIGGSNGECILDKGKMRNSV